MAIGFSTPRPSLCQFPSFPYNPGPFHEGPQFPRGLRIG